MADVHRVEPIEFNKRTSRRVGPNEVDPTIPVETARRNCVWNDREFEQGSLVVCGGATYQCVRGYWQQRPDDE